MKKKVEQYIQQFNMIQRDDEVVAGVSGGADSVCMLLLLIAYRTHIPYKLKVVHINHLIRQDASEDAEFVRLLCEANEIPFYLFEEDVKKQANELGISTEEAGRRIRYIRFNEVMESSDAKIAVAHNQNDVAETVLFNIFRGTGVEGMASLMPVNGNIIRPLLAVSRSEIESFLKENKQSYRIDSTNSTNDYSRNKIRNVILPFAEEEIVNGATEHIARLSEKMLLVREYIKKETDRAYKEVVTVLDGCLSYDLETFCGLDLLLKQELILKGLDELTMGRKDLGQVHVENILKLLDKEGEKRTDLPYNLEAIKQYDVLIIRKKEVREIQNQEYNLLDMSEVSIGDNKVIRARIFERDHNMVIPEKTYTKWFDYDKIIECPTLRHKQSGDYLTINNTMHKKSLKEYMINTKIPREMREHQLLVADGAHVMWVIGYRISEYYKVTDETKTILEIEVE